MPYFILQVSPHDEYKLSHALQEMQRRGATTLRLSPKPETGNPHISAGDIVYLWESQQSVGLVARGKITVAADCRAPLDMEPWQRVFCVDKKTGRVGDQYHEKWARAEIHITNVEPKSRIDRAVTDRNCVLHQNPFLRKRGFYSKTVFSLTKEQAQELDQLAGW